MNFILQIFKMYLRSLQIHINFTSGLYTQIPETFLTSGIHTTCSARYASQNKV